MELREESLADFLRTVYIPSRLTMRAESVNQMAITIRLLERWAGRTLTLADLSEDMLRQFLCHYAASHSPATVNSKRAQLMAVWRAAWEEDLVVSPPKARKIRKARVAIAIPEAWSPEEVGRILDVVTAARGEISGIPARSWWRSLLLTFYDTGERRAAVLRTSPRDVSLDGAWIVFPRTKTRPRYCPLSSEAVEAIAAIHDPRRPSVWPWPFSRVALEKRFRVILKAARVPYGRARGGLFHKFRRTSGTLVEAAGGDGARHIGDTRRVFEASYCDPRFIGRRSIDLLPRPISPGPRLRVV